MRPMMDESIRGAGRWRARAPRIPRFERRILFVALALQVSSLALAAASHCQAGEETHFSCQIRNSVKVASVCGGPDLSHVVPLMSSPGRQWYLQLW